MMTLTSCLPHKMLMVHHMFNLYIQCEFYSHHGQDGRTALHHAAESGHTEVVKYLIENTTAQVNAKDSVSHCLFVLYEL